MGKEIILWRVLLFIVALISIAVGYYKYILDVKNKNIVMGQSVIGIIILFGLLLTLYNVKSSKGKVIIIILLSLGINYYNYKHNTKKCNYPSLYDINLIGRSSIIIIITILVCWFNIEYDVLNIFYDESLKTYDTSTSESDVIQFSEIKEKDCSDVEGKAKEVCLRNNQEYYRRQDLAADISA